jgi:hypothetical protein
VLCEDLHGALIRAHVVPGARPPRSAQDHVAVPVHALAGYLLRKEEAGRIPISGPEAEEPILLGRLCRGRKPNAGQIDVSKPAFGSAPGQRALTSSRSDSVTGKSRRSADG